MNKELYEVLVETSALVNDKLDEESKRYLDRQILERKLDGLFFFFFNALYSETLEFNAYSEFDSIRLISFRFDSVRFDSVRFGSIRFRFGTH